MRESKKASVGRGCARRGPAVLLADPVAETNHLELETHQADALVAFLRTRGLSVLEHDRALLAHVALGEAVPGAVVEDIAVLQDLHEGRALVGSGALEGGLEVRLEHVHRSGHERGLRARARESGLNGRSSEPWGVDFDFFPSSDVGEYWPLVSRRCGC